MLAVPPLRLNETNPHTLDGMAFENDNGLYCKVSDSGEARDIVVRLNQ
jgi:hypothetical protein